MSRNALSASTIAEYPMQLYLRRTGNAICCAVSNGMVLLYQSEYLPLFDRLPWQIQLQLAIALCHH
jgi:hypothetical protein